MNRENRDAPASIPELFTSIREVTADQNLLVKVAAGVGIIAAASVAAVLRPMNYMAEAVGIRSKDVS